MRLHGGTHDMAWRMNCAVPWCFLVARHDGGCQMAAALAVIDEHAAGLRRRNQRQTQGKNHQKRPAHRHAGVVRA